VLKRLGDRTPRRIELRDIPVAQCIPRILAALGEGERVVFTSLFEDLEDRPLVIATFMALLELIRRGAVRVWQDDRHGPILLGRGDRFAAQEAVIEDEGATVQETEIGAGAMDEIDEIKEAEERGK
jgi:chromatin segregation and condensation protein Rec8/ScpA/Scc1 (kleisin family)